MKTCEISLAYRKLQVECNVKTISDSSDVYNYAKTLYNDDINIYESFFVVLLNNSSKVIGHAKIAQGSIDQCCVDVRLIAKYAIETLAVKVILVHNHPSGNINPSIQDRNLTTKINNALSLFDIKVLDHVILTDSNYYSFCDDGFICA